MLESQARAIAIAGKAKADRLAEEIPLVWRRLDLRVAVLFACHVCEIRLEGEKVDSEIAQRCLPIERLGDDALSALRAIPDSPELVEADAALMAMHPPPADRQAHEIAPAMAELAPPLLNYLQWNADRIDRELDRFYETAS